MLATRKREVTARKTAGESAKRRRAERVASRAEERATTRKASNDDASDDEVEDLDEDVVNAVADRHFARPVQKDTTETRKEKLSKKAAKRAAIRAAREAEEGYVGGGVWEKDGYEVVALAGAGDDGREGGAEAAKAFLARRDAGGRNKRASSMLLDPKTGKPLRAGGVTALGVGKKRRR